MWDTLRGDEFEASFSSRNDVSMFTAMAFELDKKKAVAVANLAGLDLLAIAYKNAGKGGGESANRRFYRGVRVSGRFPVDCCHASTGPERNGSDAALETTQGQLGRVGNTSS